MGYSEKTAFLTSVTVAQISEFSFIFVAAGVASKMVDPSILSITAVVGLVTICLSAYMILYNHGLYRWVQRFGLLRPFRASGKEDVLTTGTTRQDHIIVVGMNTLGRLIARRLHERGERVLAIDTDPHKLAGLPCETMLGNVEYLSVLEEASLSTAKLLVSALRIEPTNDLLAYRAHCAGVPSSITVVDVSTVDTLLEMDVDYLMIPKVDGIKLQTKELQRMNFLTE
jgi:hypothetical protein